jgi:SAM-dependent methyltransferase
MKGWADWLVEHGQADAAMIAEAERVLEAAQLKRGDTVLDVGSGLGLLTLAAHDRIGDGWVIAVDPSVGALEELLRLAHEANANGVMYLVGDAEVLPLPDASVDAAVLRSVLVHVPDVDVAVTELARVLRPGGRLSLREPLNRSATFISTAVDWSPLGELGERLVALWTEATGTDPLQRLDPDALAASLTAAGFVDLDVSVDDPGEEWLVTEESVAERLDMRGGPGHPSLRERWQAAFTPDEVDRLVAHLASLAGTIVVFRRPQLFLSARRP